MDDRTELDSTEKDEMRGLVLAGAARADSIRRLRSRIAVSASAVVVVAGIAVGAGFASGTLGRGSVTPIAPAPAPLPSANGSAPWSDGDIVAFERPPTEIDRLPDEMTDEAKQSVIPETSRYIGEHADIAYWVVQGEDPGSMCVVSWHLQRVDARGVACAGGELTTTRPGLFEAHLGPAGTAPGGWIELDDNLSVNPNP